MSAAENENPRSAEHLEAQRDRILNAAETCFIKYGFHAASMARIAETAEISQGLAYRYFENKNAIILAIIERQLENRQSIIEYGDSPDVFVQHILEIVTSWAEGGNAKINPVLFIEMCAEASRTPEIRDAMCTTDCHYLKDFTNWIRQSAKKAGKTVSAEDIARRFYTLQSIVEGSAFIASRRDKVEDIQKNKYFVEAIKQVVTV